MTGSIKVDRPARSAHPQHGEIVYPMNYGYVPGTIAPDGSELDVYVLGSDQPLAEVEAKVIAIVRRRDDVEDKLVASVGGEWDADSIGRAVAFQEQFFNSWIESYPSTARDSLTSGVSSRVRQLADPRGGSHG